MGEGEGVRIKLFQFWNTERAPDEVEVLMQTWAEDPSFEYHRFNSETADAFIEGHFDIKTLSAYRMCGVPAMQADLFRYCALYQFGGIYIDADSINCGGLLELVSNRIRGLLMLRQNRVANDFLNICLPRDPLLEKVINRAVDNIDKEVSNNVWEVTGPGIMTKEYNSERKEELFSGFDFLEAREIVRYVNFRNDLLYKKSSDHWVEKLKLGSKIFK